MSGSLTSGWIGKGEKSRKDWYKVKHSQDVHDPTLSAPREAGIERANRDDKMLIE